MNITINYDSPLSIKTFLQEHNLNIQKRFGQNFLIVSSVRTAILNALNIKKCDTVWEIGAGLGAMTLGLLQNDANVTVFEIDRGYCAALKDFFGYEKKFTLVEGDVLKTSLEMCKGDGNQTNQKNVPKYILGNLPYNIAALLIAKFIESGIHPERAVFTVQKEVAERLSAKPKSKEYSSLSVLCSSVYDVKIIKVLSGKMFYPVPNVDSACVLFQKKNNIKPPPEFFYSFVRSLFAARRKTILNNLNVFVENEGGKIIKHSSIMERTPIKNNFSTKDFCIEILNRSNIDINERAQNMTRDQFLAIAEELKCCL